MYNVNITGSFSGVFPGTVAVPSRQHSYAVAHYKRAFRASIKSSGSRTVLESVFGFHFRVDAAKSSSRTSTTIRLSLPQTVDRVSVAKSLGTRATKSRAGLIVKDPYGITWTIA